MFIKVSLSLCTTDRKAKKHVCKSNFDILKYTLERKSRSENEMEENNKKFFSVCLDIHAYMILL